MPDGSKVKKLLGLKYTSLRQTMVDTVKDLLEAENWMVLRLYAIQVLNDNECPVDFRHLRADGKAWHEIHALFFQARNRNRVTVQSLFANRVFSRPICP